MMARSWSLRRTALALLAVIAGGCGRCDGGGGRDPVATAPPTAAPAGTSAPASNAGARVAFDFVREIASCDTEHRGLLVDGGTDAMVGRFGWLVGAPPGVRTVEHDGSTWMRVQDKKVDLTFTLLAATPLFVSARIQGLAARNASVYLDDQPLGTLALAREQIRAAQTNATALPVDPGLHTLTLRFAGRARGADEAFADVDWIRLGVPDESSATFGPPTLRDLVAPAAALAGVPHRALALRAPSGVRCSMRLAPASRLRAAVGLQGAGEGDAEVRVLRDGKRTETIHRVHVTGGDKGAWTDIDVPLGEHAQSVVTLELAAIDAPRGTRVLFGDPAVVLPPPAPAPTPEARAVVIVVLDGVERSELPPWGDRPGALPALTELAQYAATFDRHRAPTTVVAATMASLLTGLPPRAHALTDASARLPQAQTTIGAIARDASVRAAMFTGVPSTFRPFGFGAAWERFVEHAPNAGDPATAPIDDATAWVAEVAREAPEARLLAVVHARGGHPPWDVGVKELAALVPHDYAGLVEPRRAAQVLARMRKRRGGPALPPADRDRARALEAIAMAGQDRAIGALVAALRTANLWESTLFVVMGDVASGASEPALFGDGLDLREPLLTLPLYVHFPGGLHAGRRVAAPSSVVDVTRTALAALALATPKEALGRDLAPVAAGSSDAWHDPQIATLADRYSVRWDDLLLTGRAGAAPYLCNLAVDPTCAFNRRETLPLAAQALFRRFVAADLATRAPPERREPATIDAETQAKLSVWGATE